MGYSIEPFDINDKERWNRLLSASLYPSYRQTIDVEYLTMEKGREIATFIVKQDSVDIAGVHYSIKRSKFNLLSTADILSGILLTVEPTEELLTMLINHFISYAKSKGVAYMRISPWLPMIVDGVTTPYESVFNRVLFNKGFNKINEGRHTYWIDLTLSQEELLKRMNTQTRRNINKALKANLKVEVIESFSVEEVKLFYRLYHQLGEIKAFDTLTEDYFLKSLEVLMNNGATLFIIKCQNVVINVGLTTTFGIASYYHGALNHDYKSIKDCPAPGQYMQWLMINHLKERGHSLFDMAFCPGPIPIASHPNYNMWRFKHGFGGMHVQFLPTYGKAIKPLMGQVFKFIRYKKL
ncbi:MAG TPA: peptidoglycan bridge formation glycyltransferase FemA/FemB family protein [Tenuifilaceae bacterium]|nr:peptidoglycan bridge formation glycyltransferase FemA/FemB family protein [Bacteroidales bacterium]OQC65248.1 MAG: FemAB family protein [Bacteroidetes bacterium ADurb.Bin008]HOM85548.1 peptidoglycan bridge formation glycyltransferase FemA/FemB family protein [Tenuifilaceae bacterium]HOU63437.1 peptidoglycan bridge formation glycyltransferase FemA/FemB family protein [Tenuifilaceae bacterium]HPC69152.1 peptidoglycan bridge formation glycyltransferase FemA/FemB family protein [Tenuifilaceae ba